MQERMNEQTYPKTCSCDILDTEKRGKILKTKRIDHSKISENPPDIS